MIGALPEQASVVVIGGGVMGCSTLYHLASEGVTDAILLERNELTSERPGIRQRRFALCALQGT